MKPIYFLVLFVLFSACEGDEKGQPLSHDLLGQWEWIQSTGGIAGLTHTPESTKSTRQLIFTNSEMSSYVNGELEYIYPYKVELKTSIITGNRQPMIVTADYVGMSMSFEIQKNRLYLTDECYDCYQSIFEKNKEEYKLKTHLQFMIVLRNGLY